MPYHPYIEDICHEPDLLGPLHRQGSCLKVVHQETLESKQYNRRKIITELNGKESNKPCQIAGHGFLCFKIKVR